MAETIIAPAPVTLCGDRTRTVPLEYPAELANGTTLCEVTVRRMTAAEVQEFIAAATAGQEVSLPMFDQPPEILDALDPDDVDELNRVATEMLPRRLRRALEAVADPISAATAAVNDLAASAAALAPGPPRAEAQD